MKSLVYFSLIFLAFSCAPRKEITYFHSGTINDKATVNISYTPVFKIDDLLGVVVSSEDLESTVAFNMTQSSREPLNYSYSSGTPVMSGYLVDSNGDVELPVIGKVHVAGKTRSAVINELSKIYAEYLKSPVVNVQIRNFKVTVLGAVQRPGTFHIPNERITVLEAIGIAGDLRIEGVRTNILVIRDRDGLKTEYRLDLTSSDILDSPAYYLEQNDVVYVEPNLAGRSQAAFWRQSGPIFISLTSIIVSTVAIILR
jgi:polysaccharide export outer membrane protein